MSYPDVDLDERGDLVEATPDGPRKLRAARSFPWSHPDRFIVLRDSDDHEIACIDDLRKLPARCRGAIEAWLQRHTLVPKVLRVNRIEITGLAMVFDLETDRGDSRAIMKDREELRHLDDGRLLLRDSDGQTYEFPPLEELDERSRSELAKLI